MKYGVLRVKFHYVYSGVSNVCFENLQWTIVKYDNKGTLNFIINIRNFWDAVPYPEPVNSYYWLNQLSLFSSKLPENKIFTLEFVERQSLHLMTKFVPIIMRLETNNTKNKAGSK